MTPRPTVGHTLVERARPADTFVAGLAVVLASAGLVPLFTNASWVPPAVAGVIAVALAGMAARAVALPVVLVPVAEVLALLLAVDALVAGDLAWGRLVPTSSALQEITATLGEGVAQGLVAQAPAPTDPGLVLLAVVGVGLVAMCVDTLFVSTRLPLLAGVPLLAMVLIGPLIPRGGYPWWAFAVPAAGWLLILAADQRERVRRWAGTPGARVRGLSAQGRRIGVVAIAAATLVGIGVTGIKSTAIAGGAGSGGATPSNDPYGAVILDPLASMRRDLMQPQEVEVLRYRTDATAPTYLRMSVLEEFDGDTWRPRAGLTDRRDTGSPLPGPVPAGSSAGSGAGSNAGRTDLGGAPVFYDIRITSLANPSLPLPYPATEVTGLPAGAWRADASTGIAYSGGLPADGLSYRVQALSRSVDPRRLRGAGPPSGDAEQLLALPRSTSDTVQVVAKQVTAGAVTPYDRAVALQRWFTVDGGFTYSTDVPSGARSDYIEEFLRDRVGYCEQFAGAMAVMARSVGIPSRVVVGFTQGSLSADDTWRVTTRDAHAWPELWFDGIGWVRFEPTPRGGATVQAPEYAPVDLSSIDVVDARRQALLDLQSDEGPAAGAPEQRSGSWVTLLVGSVVALGVLLALVALSVPMLRRRWNRRRRLSDDAHAAEGAWRELVATAVDLGYPWPVASTPRQAGDLLARGLSARSASALHRLRGELERERYGRPESRAGSGVGSGAGVDAVSKERAEALRNDLRVVEAQLRRRARWQARVAAYCWPSSERRRQRSSMRSMNPEVGLGARGEGAVASSATAGRALNDE